MTSMHSIPRHAARLALATLLVAAPTACVLAAEATLVFDLRERAEIDAERVHLGDLVEVRRNDEQLADSLLAMDLGPAPRLGQPAHIERDQLAAWVKARRPALAGRMAWEGVQTIEVRRTEHVLDLERLDSAARDALDRWLASRSDRHDLVRVDAEAGMAPIALPSGEVALAVRPFAAATRPASRMRVWVDVRVEGRFQRTVPVDYRVHAWKAGYEAGAELHAGEDVDDARLRAAEVDIAAMEAPAWIGSIDRVRVRREVHAGRSLTTLDLEFRPPVVRGERVTLSSHTGELSIEANAQALQDGRLGERIAVRVDGSTAPVLAWVIKPGLVGMGKPR